jgi:FkbM family methyltransferase
MKLLARYLSLASRYCETPKALGVKVLGGIPSTYHELDQTWFKELNIDYVIDVGANIGQFAVTARKLLPHAKILSLEPIPACFEQFRKKFQYDSNIIISNIAASDSVGTVAFSVSVDTGASSLLPMGKLQKEIFPDSTKITKINIQTNTLDFITQSSKVGDNIFLKIDVQGFELNVLRGANEILKKTKLILVETSFDSFYEGQALFCEVYKYLIERDFMYLHSFNVLKSKKGKPVQGDFIFIQNTK